MTVLLPTTTAQGPDIYTYLTAHFRPIRIRYEAKEEKILEKCERVGLFLSINLKVMIIVM